MGVIFDPLLAQLRTTDTGLFVLKSGDTMTGQLTVQTGFATIETVNTNTSQFAGGKFVAINNMSSMGNQGGGWLVAGIADIGQTQGYMALEQTDYRGNFVATLLKFDYQANTATISKSLKVSGEVGINTPINTSIGLTIDPGNDANKGMVIFAHSGTQSANLFEIENSSFSPVFQVTKSGVTTISDALLVQYDFASFSVKNTASSQFAGAGFHLINTVSSMANSAGVSAYMGIDDVSATQGFFTIDTTDNTGGGTGHVMLFHMHEAGGGVTDMTFYTGGNASFFLEKTKLTLGSASNTIILAMNAEVRNLQVPLAPSVSQTINANNSASVVRSYTIASGTKLTINSGARFRIL